jgi:Cu/Ag efflux pump CusA
MRISMRRSNAATNARFKQCVRMLSSTVVLMSGCVSYVPAPLAKRSGVRGKQAQAQAQATRELLIHAAAAFVLIVELLALAFGRARQVLLVLLALPSTVIGGVIAVALTGAALTPGAIVGFVALFGMAARNSILLVSHYDHLVSEENQPWSLATALRGAEERLTLVLLTALLTAFALLPVALQLHQPGHEIERPMAAVILPAWFRRRW